ncbi:MAG: TetR/AcrR family transcriptional regulator [Clostridium celatum]|nr:TetR/AcrR family transcriptional regulator [Clostridium celatum]
MKTEKSNSYVKKQITKALIKLMQTNSFEEIKITDIVKEAMVGRASFYRNFTNKEDVLKQYLIQLIQEWGSEFEQSKDPNLVESLFNHYKKYSEFYKLLYYSNLFHLVLDNIKSVCGPKPEQDSLQAYTSAWFAYGLFGWINEWVARGMNESPTEMSQLGKLNG